MNVGVICSYLCSRCSDVGNDEPKENLLSGDWTKRQGLLEKCHCNWPFIAGKCQLEGIRSTRALNGPQLEMAANNQKLASLLSTHPHHQFNNYSLISIYLSHTHLVPIQFEEFKPKIFKKFNPVTFLVGWFWLNNQTFISINADRVEAESSAGNKPWFSSYPFPQLINYYYYFLMIAVGWGGEREREREREMSSLDNKSLI